MISLARHGDAIRALQDDSATLGQQVAALSSQFATAFQAATSAAARLEQLGGIVAELKVIRETQAGIIDEQAVQIAALRAEAERRDERVSQLHGDLARTQRQAALDLDEMRTTAATITQALLVLRERQLAEPKA